MSFDWLVHRFTGCASRRLFPVWSQAVVLGMGLAVTAASAGAGPLFSSPTFDVGLGPIAVAIGDVSGDGKLDLLAANNSTTTVSVLLGSGGGDFQAKVDYGTGLNPASVAIGDLNGDGKPDLVAANYGALTMSILLGNGNGRSLSIAYLAEGSLGGLYQATCACSATVTETGAPGTRVSAVS